MGTGRGRGPSERVVLAVVVIQQFTNTGRREPSNKDKVLPGKLPLVKLEMGGAGAVLLELRRTALIVGEPPSRIAYGPRSGEGRRELRKGAGVLAEHLRNGLPIIEGEPERKMLLESDVADKDGTVKICRPGSRERQRVDTDIGVGLGSGVDQDRRSGAYWPGECANGNAEGSTSVSVSASSPAGPAMLAGLPDQP